MEETIQTEDTLMHLRDSIDRCFLVDSFDEVLVRLKEEGSVWARETLQKIESVDLNLAKITFESIKRAKQLTFVECLHQEMAVLENYLRDSSMEIEKYFVPPMKMYLDAPDYALLPVKEYKDFYPDYFRTFINKYNRVQPAVLEHFEKHVRHFLQSTL